MLNSGTNTSRVSTAASSSSSDMPPLLPQCLRLEPITLGNQKYMRSRELRRVLGVPPGSMSEEHSFGAAHPKSVPPVATEELINFKESVQDASKKARDRARMLHESLSKLEKYKEALNSKKRHRNDIAVSERSGGGNVGKLGSQIHRNPHDIMTQRLEDRAKSVGLNKRVPTSVADVKADVRATAPSRQQMVIEKAGDMLQDIGGSTSRFEEKIRRLPAGGEGWDTKNKKKRSVGVVGSRVLNGERDMERPMYPTMSAESKMRLNDSQGFRSKSSPGLSGSNKLDSSLEPTSSDTTTVRGNELESGPSPRDRMALLEPRPTKKFSNKPSLHENNLASCPNSVVKAKVSRGPRTGSIMLLDSSLKAHPSFTSLQGAEQPAGTNKAILSGVANHKRQMSAGSSSHAMAQWVGQRPHKNSRTRRANIVAPVSSQAETETSSQGFSASECARTSSMANNGLVVASSIDNSTPKIKKEHESIPSPFGLSESEESGAGEIKLTEKHADSGEAVMTTTETVGAFQFPPKKNKLTSSEIGDGVQRQGRSGRGSTLIRPGMHSSREKLETLPTTKPYASLKPSSEKNKSKTGRPPSKKLKDKKASARVGSMLNAGSLDFTGESDDDRQELFVAAKSACNASRLACSGTFWKKSESVFASLSSEDMSYLKKQLKFAEELDESLSEMHGMDFDVLGVLVHKGVNDYSSARQRDDSHRESIKTATVHGRVETGRLDRSTPLYQRVLSALIEEDESEELYIHNEGKNMSLHYASDDSHCGSCNLIDIESRDKDRIESEVESNVNFQSQKNCFMDRFSSDKSVASNIIRNPSVSSSLHSNEQWLGDDDFPHSDAGHVSEICSFDLGQLQMRQLNVPGLSSSDHHYQLMCLDDRVLLELQSIGLCPETLPDLAEGEEVINQDIVELEEQLYQQIRRKKKKLVKIDKAVEKVRDVERRKIEQVAMDQLIERAYRKRMACRGNNPKSAVRKVSRQVALAFVRRTLDRCQKFEKTGTSCFNEPSLQEVIFSTPPCNNDTKSIDCVGSGTASNTVNEVSNHRAEARGSGAVSSSPVEKDDSDRGKKKEVLIDDVIGSASSRITSTLDSSVLGGVKGKRSDRDRDREQNKDNLRINSGSGASRSSLDGFKSERKPKSKPKQKSNQNGPPRLSSQSNANVASNKMDSKIPQDASKEGDEPVDFENLQLNELDPIGLGVSSDLSGQQDLGTWLNFEEDGLQDHYSIGLEIPMDDLSDLNMLM